MTDALVKFQSNNPLLKSKIASYKEKQKEIIVGIHKIFDLRNIICHEMASEISINKYDAIKFYNNVSAFIFQTYYFISELLYPEVDDKQAGIEAKQKFENVSKELDEFIESIKEKPTTYLGNSANMSLLIKSIENWKSYRNDYVNSMMEGLETDADFNYLLFDELAELTNEKLEDLKLDFSYEDFNL